MCAAAVDQPGHVALRVLQIEILRAVVGDGHGAQLAVGEVQGSAQSIGSVTSPSLCFAHGGNIPDYHIGDRIIFCSGAKAFLRKDRLLDHPRNQLFSPKRK